MAIKVKYTLERGAKAPMQGTKGAACFDLHAHNLESIAEESMGSFRARIYPGDVVRVPTGLRLQIPEGCEGLVRGRSGLALEGLHVHAGTIDSDYRGEVAVILSNISNKPIDIRTGDRIAQLAVRKAEVVELEAGKLDATERGGGGFGSTGR